MLLTFRLFLGGASLVILALAVIARGLIPMPEVRTRVGEVPTLGRSLIQEAMILRAFIDVSDGPTGKRAEETKAVRELSHSDVALAPAAATIASPASEPASAAESRETGSRPSGDLAPVLLPETQSVHALPEVASTGETQAPSGAPALAFAAENLTAPITGEGGERAGAAQSKARRHQAKADGPHHRSGKRTKKVGTSKQKLAANPTEFGSLGVNVSASPSPKTAGPRPPHLLGRLLHPESLAAKPRVGQLTAHSASVLAGRIEQTHKLQDNRREVKIWGFRATPDVKAHGELPVE